MRLFALVMVGGYSPALVGKIFTNFVNRFKRGFLTVGKGLAAMVSGPRSTRDTDAEFQAGWKMAGLGLTVSTEVLAGAGIGYLADHWGWTTAPTGVTWGALIGIVVGMWSLIKGALKLNKQLDQRHPTKGRGEPLLEEEDDEADREG